MKQTQVFKENLKLLSQNMIANLADLVSSLPREDPPQPPSSNIDQSYLYPPPSKTSSVHYVYGIEKGHYFLSAKKWLDQDCERFVCFIEDDLKILRALLEKKEAKQLLKHPQIIIHYFPPDANLEENLDPLPWFFSPLSPSIICSPSYKRFKFQRFQEIHHYLLSQTARLTLIFEEELSFGKDFFKNFYGNLLEIPSSYQGSKLFNKFQGVPAIICGSGPSLQNNMHLLKDAKKKALLIAAGSSLAALNGQGITPHLFAAFSPTSLQQARLKNHVSFETALIYQNRLNKTVLKNNHSFSLLINKPESYPIVEWLENKLNISEVGSTEGGFSIANFCTSLAKDLGCNPIIFVGLDLAYTNGAWYSPGVMPSEKQSYSKAPENCTWKQIIHRKDIFGNSIQSTWNWLAESEWIRSFSKKNPNIRILNATEGGLGIKGVDNISLEDLLNNTLKRQYDLKGRLHCDIIHSFLPQITIEQSLLHLSELYDSFVRCSFICKNLKKEISQKIQAFKHNLSDQESLESEKSIHLKEKLSKEVAYQPEFDFKSCCFQK